jgi:hypothetical protein
MLEPGNKEGVCHAMATPFNVAGIGEVLVDRLSQKGRDIVLILILLDK